MAALRSRLSALGGVVGLGLLGGCLPIPTPPHELGPAPDHAAVAALQTGPAQRSDVLLALGEPHYRLQGDRFLMYEWQVAYGYIFFGGPGGGAMFPATAPHFLCFEFGDDARVVRQSALSGSLYTNADKAIEKCTHPPEGGDGKDGE